MAALRNGINTVLIPKDNVRDLEEIDQTVRAALHFVPVETVDPVFAATGRDGEVPARERWQSRWRRLPPPGEKTEAALRQ